MSVRVRFAPSPTGFLHVGGARTALFNYLFARSMGGTFVLRIEDTDAERSTEESVGAILKAMRWLGLGWDEGPEVGGPHGPYFQTQRRAHYDDALRQLVASGHAYPAYETPEELEAMREGQVARGESPRYDGSARGLTAEARARLESEGRRPAWRLRAPDSGETGWDDVVRGRIAFPNEVLDDFVLVRSDGLPTYNFACVVDDLGMRISHVIRGDDHISNTPRQLLLYRALGADPPAFAHASMILGPDGKRLSKRHGATSVEAFGELGIIPEAMVNFLALLGWAYDDRTELFSLGELERVFRIDRIGANPAVFDVQKLEWMNGQHLKRLTEDERVTRLLAFLAARGSDPLRHPRDWWDRFVNAMGERLRTLADAENLGRFALEEELQFDPAAWDKLLAQAQAGPRLLALAESLERTAFDSLPALEETTRGLAARLGVKAGEVIAPARIALTGSMASPGIFECMALIGRERCLDRLRRAAGRWEQESGTPTRG